MFVVSGGDPAPVLQLVEGAFDDVAVLVVIDVVADGSAAAGTLVPAVAALVTRFGDHGLDAARTQVSTVGAGRVRLVFAQRLGRRAWPARPQPWDAKIGQKSRQGRGIVGLAWGDRQHQRLAAAVDQGVGLGGQATARAPDGGSR